MHQPEQLQLFDFVPQHQIKAIHDPYWDELEADNSDIVEQAFLSIDIEIAPQQNICLGAQLPSLASPYKCVGAQVVCDTKKSAPQHDAKLYRRATEENPTHWVEKYWVERVGNKYWYYRYCWMEGRKKSRIYIGAVASKKAQVKKRLVEEAILDGQSPEEIKEILKARTHFGTIAQKSF